MLLRSFFTNSIGILTSRVFGFIRDLMTASILGANIYSDIFFVAFKLPNLFRRIFAEGAFTQAFLPAFTKSRNKGIFVAKTLMKFALFLFVLSLLVMLFAPWLTKLIAYGFDEPTIALAAPLVRLNFWYLLLIYFVTFAASLLHYRHHFATTAFSTALLNIAMIIALLFSDPAEPENTVYYLSYGVIAGGLFQAFVHVVALKKERLFPLLVGGFLHVKRPRPQSTTEPRFYKNFFHGILGTSTAQISAFLDTWLASFLALGSISYLYYANRIFQLPLALFAIALSVAIFPRITREIKKKNIAQAQRLLNKGFWFLATLLSLSMVGGIVLSQEIIWLLFERGSFSPTDTSASAWVLSMYMIGLLPFGLSKLFSLWLYANERQKEAAKIAAWSLGANIVLSLALISPLEAAGLALASSLSGFVLLVLTVRAYGTKEFLAIILGFKLPALLLTLVIEGIALYYLKDLFHGYL